MNYDHRLTIDLITGLSGSGKTTLYLQKLSANKARWKIIFDPQAEFCRKCNVKPCYTQRDLEDALIAGRPAAFEPSAMFPSDFAEGYAFLCRWTVNVSKRLRGPKLFASDEVWKYTLDGLPVGQLEMLNIGRKEEIDQLYVAQRLNKVKDEIRANLTGIYVFRQTDKLPLDWLEEHGFDRAEVAALGYPGGFIYKNLLTSEVQNFNTPRKTSCGPTVKGRSAKNDRQ